MDKQFKRKLRLLGLALLVLVCTGVVFASLSLYHYLKKPLVAASEGVIFDKGWGGRSRLDLLLLGVNAQEQLERVSVITIDSAGASLTLLEIPLGLLSGPSLEKTAPPLSLPPHLVSRLLGIPLDGYLLITPLGVQKLSKSIGGPLNFQNLQKLATPLSWHKIPSLLATLKEDVRTNLSLLDFFQLVRAAANVRFDKVKEMTLTNEFFSKVGQREQFLTEAFSEVGIVEERARILVLNGTGKPGLAAQASRLITHLGGYVLDTNNASRTDYKENLLLVSERAPYTFRRLSEIFNVTKYQPTAAFSEDPLFSYMQRADLVLILGLDSVGRL